jgi:prolyl-tRNA editing enzyme YbaK/EbsC (Cys-tRNA(Pro) deacylase)
VWEVVGVSEVDAEQMHPSVLAVVEAAGRLGVELEVREFPQGTRTAAEAAAAVGVGVGQIVKSLVFAVDGRLVLALVSGSNRVDLELLAAAAGGGSVAKPDADTVREATGFSIGGVAPIGHASELATFLDEDLLQYETVWPRPRGPSPRS